MKKKILALFDPAKASWIAPIEALKTEFEVEFLWNFKVRDFRTDSKVHHFNDFASIEEIFSVVRPDVIFFMSIDTGLSVSINLFAKSRGVRTFLLQHGYFGSFEDYKVIAGSGKQTRVDLPVINPSLRRSVKRYLLKSHPYQLFRLVAFLSLRKDYHPGTKGFLGHFFGKRPDRYILWSEAAFDRFRRNDGASPEQARYTGNFEAYSILHALTPAVPLSGYVLLIDSPFADNSYGLFNLTKEQHIQFYLRLANYAKGQGRKLVVKLHPEMYASNWMPENENILYLKAEFPIKSLIEHADLCMSFYSSLLIPIVLMKKVLVFEIFELSLTRYLKEQKICSVCNFNFSNIDSLEILDNTKSEKLSEFIELFCGPIKSMPTIRLHDYLKELDS